VLETTYFLAAPIIRAKRSIQSGLAPVGTGLRHPASINSYVNPGREEGIGLGDALGRMRLQVFVRGNVTVIAAPVQRDVDGIPRELGRRFRRSAGSARGTINHGARAPLVAYGSRGESMACPHRLFESRADVLLRADVLTTPILRCRITDTQSSAPERRLPGCVSTC
jgi:hypothetical protein